MSSVFGDRLRSLREAKDMKQEELGEIAGVGKATISGYEKGKRFPDFEKLVLMANHFGVTTDYMLGRTEDPYSSSPNVSENAAKISKIFGNLSVDEQDKFFAFLEMTFRDKMPK
ncbi:helix-turn-helix domain-containing protein [Brevibacillus porteri]|uniref:helix-turn-helix domain-containing protein n=1 Tax=Brevibacillus porteri TaxID=2126350 RepID=UPI003D1B2EE1